MRDRRAASPSTPTTPRRWTPGTRCGPGRARTACRSTSSRSPSGAPPRSRPRGPRRAAGPARRGRPRELAGTLDAEAAVARLARLVVPALADWCIAHPRRRATAAARRRRRRWQRRLGRPRDGPGARRPGERYADRALDALAARRVPAGARLHGRSRPSSSAATRPQAVQALLTAGRGARACSPGWRPESVAVIPLRGARPHLGLLTLYSGAGRGARSAPRTSPPRATSPTGPASRWTTPGSTTPAARAGRGAAAQPAHRAAGARPRQIVVRYQPAAEAAQVGGDWYDAFLQPGGATMLVIGDVVGHDTAAAAAMGQLRGLLRGIAGLQRRRARRGAARAGRGDADPADRAPLATAAVARLEQTADERAAGRHPAALGERRAPAAAGRSTRTARSSPCSAVDADLLLGVDAGSERRESVVTLDRGATVLLLHRRPGRAPRPDLDAGLTRLRERASASSRDLPLDELLRRAAGAAAPRRRREDDVALVAVRLHRQDRPRPAEAGPNVVPDTVPDTPAVDPDAG